MLNRITSILTGCAAGIAVIFAMEKLSHGMYPIPEGLDPMNMQDIKKIMATMPTGAHLMVLLSGFLGALAGGIVCALMARENTLRNVLVVGAILTALGLLNGLMLGHPWWFNALCFVIYFAGAYLGYKLLQIIKKDAKKS
jgi:hypothetical protein